MFLPLTLALFVAVCFGVSKVLIRKATNVGTLRTVLYTLILAPPLLLSFSLLNGESFLSYNYSSWILINLALAGITFLVAGRIFAYSSIRLIGAARSSQLTSTQVIFAAILSIAFLQEEMSAILLIGTLAIFLGTILISLSYPRGEENRTVMPRRNFSKGFSLGLLGGFFWGLSQLFSREGVRGLGSPAIASFLSYLFAISFLILIMPVTQSKKEEAKPQKAEAIYVLAAGALSTFAVLAQYTALRIADVVWVTPIVNTSPLVTLVVSYFFIQKVEFVNTKVIFGCLAIIFGAFIIALNA